MKIQILFIKFIIRLKLSTNHDKGQHVIDSLSNRFIASPYMELYFLSNFLFDLYAVRETQTNIRKETFG